MAYGEKRVLCLRSRNAIHCLGRSLQGEHSTVYFGYTSGNQLIHGGSKKAQVTGRFWQLLDLRGIEFL